MLNIVFGLIAICLGIWGLFNYWWYVLDVFIAILPIVLITGGVVALLAGIKNTGLRTKVREDKARNAESVSDI
ncbi:MAG: hypothetical protein VST72_04090 [Nitrospirota bacterium]|nr:hypothetical protein [Nitrospirota bacterium]